MSKEPWEGHEVEVVNPRYVGASPSDVARSLRRPVSKAQETADEGEKSLDEPED